MLRFPALAFIWLMVATLSAQNVPEAPLPAHIGPYLQHPAADAMSVCLISQTAKTVAIQVRPANPQEKAPAPVTAEALAIPGTPWSRWTARLHGLPAGGRCAYQVIIDGNAGPWLEFRTLDPAAPELRFAVFNDVHDQLATLDRVLAHVPTDSFEFSVLLGDCWNDPQTKNQADRVFRTLDGFVRRLDAGRKPMLYVRGNHDLRGPFAPQLARLFIAPRLRADAPLGEQDVTLTFAAGPAFLLFADTGEDFEKKKEVFNVLRERQTPWLRSELASPAAQGRWRLFLSHIPLFNDNIWNSEHARKVWTDVLAEGKVDAAFAGHDHGWKLLPKNQPLTVRFKASPVDSQFSDGTVTSVPPFPVLIGGGPKPTGKEQGTAMLFKVTPKACSVRLIGAETGALLTQLELTR